MSACSSPGNHNRQQVRPYSGVSTGTTPPSFSRHSIPVRGASASSEAAAGAADSSDGSRQRLARAAYQPILQQTCSLHLTEEYAYFTDHPISPTSSCPTHILKRHSIIKMFLSRVNSNTSCGLCTLNLVCTRRFSFQVESVGLLDTRRQVDVDEDRRRLAAWFFYLVW